MYLLGAPEIDMVAAIRDELADAQNTIGQQAAEISRLQQQTDQDAYLSEACRSMERSYNMVKAQAMELEEERPVWQAEVDRLGSQVQKVSAASAADSERLQGQLEQAAAARAADAARFDAERRASEDAMAKAARQLAEAAAAHQQVAKSRDALNLEVEDQLVELRKAREENQSIAATAAAAAAAAAAAEHTSTASSVSLNARIASLEQEMKAALSRATAAESECGALKLATEMQSGAHATTLKEAGEQAAELRNLVQTKVERHAEEIAAAAANVHTAEAALAAERAAAADAAVASAAESTLHVATAASDASGRVKAVVEQASATLKGVTAAAAAAAAAAAGSKKPADIRVAVLECLAEKEAGAADAADAADATWARSILAGLAMAVTQLLLEPKEDPELKLNADLQQTTIAGLQKALDEVNNGLDSMVCQDGAQPFPALLASSSSALDSAGLVTNLLAQIQIMRDKALAAYGDVRSLETRVAVTAKELDQRIDEITEMKMAAAASACVAELQSSADAALEASGQREAALASQVAALTAAVQAAEEAAATATQIASAAQVAATAVPKPADNADRILELEDDLWTQSAKIQDLEGQLRMLQAQHVGAPPSSDDAAQGLLVQLRTLQADAAAMAALLAAKEADVARLTTALQTSSSSPAPSPPPLLSPHPPAATPAAIGSKELGKIEGELKAARAQSSKYLDTIEMLQAQAAALEAERNSVSDEDGAASEKLKAVKTTLELKERDVIRLTALLTDTKAQADNNLKERIHTLQLALTTSEAEAAAAVAAQKKLKMDTVTELATLRATLKHSDAAMQELANGQDMAATAVQQGARLREEVADLEKQVVALEESLAAETAKTQAMEDSAAAAVAAAAASDEAGAAAAQDSAERALVELKGAKDQLSKAVNERDQLKDALKKTTTELKQTSARLAEATGTLEGNSEQHIKLRQLVMRRYEKTVSTVWDKVAHGKELEFEANIIDNPIDRDADPTREWNNHCSELDKMLLKGVAALATQIANFPAELEKVKEAERQELNRVKRLHTDQADRLKTKIKRSQETLESFDGSLSELEAVKQQAEADAAKLLRAQSDLKRVTKKLEEQRSQVVAMRDRLDDEKQLVQQLTRQVAAGRAPQTRALPTAVVAEAAPDEVRAPTRAQDRSKSQKIKERLNIVANDGRDFRKKNAKLITTLRKENATHKLESTKASAKVEVMNHRLEKAKEHTQKLTRRLSMVDGAPSVLTTKPSTNA